MFVAKSIAVDHKDLIHDVSYDFHGRRMATCSSDQFVKVGLQILDLVTCVSLVPEETHSTSAIKISDLFLLHFHDCRDKNVILQQQAELLY